MNNGNVIRTTTAGTYRPATGVTSTNATSTYIPKYGNAVTRTTTPVTSARTASFQPVSQARPLNNITTNTVNGMPTTYRKYESGTGAPVVTTTGSTAYLPKTTTIASTTRPVVTANTTTYAPLTKNGLPTIPVQSNYNGAPVIERKLIYRDPNSGARMMKVCTPNGTIKRVECLDEIVQPPLPVNNDLDEETEMMIRDAKIEFGDPDIEEFNCDECKFSNFPKFNF